MILLLNCNPYCREIIQGGVCRKTASEAIWYGLIVQEYKTVVTILLW